MHKPALYSSPCADFRICQGTGKSLCFNGRGRESLKIHRRVWRGASRQEGLKGELKGTAKGDSTELEDLENEGAAAWLGSARYYVSWLFPLSGMLALQCLDLGPWIANGPLSNVGITAHAASVAVSFSGVMFAFCLLPMLDNFFGRDRSATNEVGRESKAYKIPLYSCVPLHLALVFLACQAAGKFATSPAAFIGVLFSVASSGGLAFTVAHELLHRHTPLDRILCNALLCSLFYMHWSESHLSHHRKVGTNEDPSSARYGESFYHFLPRSIIGNLKDGVHSEARRLHSQRKSFFSLHNRVAFWLISPLMQSIGIWFLFGYPGLLMLAGSSLVAIGLLESVNYIEHYGLERSHRPNGRYEPVQVRHSWNADWSATSAGIFQLQRHSHHHANASLPYQALQSVENAPQLPASYPMMMILSWFPPLFYKVMNPRVLQVSEGSYQ